MLIAEVLMLIVNELFPPALRRGDFGQQADCPLAAFCPKSTHVSMFFSSELITK
jgi:hypothetical protein